jgi:prepilin-type N-terminal cleavage/methylation domain-containing protein
MNMNNRHRHSHAFSRIHVQRRQQSGFSLVELMVAMGIFLIIGSAAVSLVNQHTKLFDTTQNQAVLNVTLRNAAAQLQMEVVNAGSGYSAVNAMPFWPVGMTITKAPTGIAPCQAIATYTAGCFDSLTLITADSSMPAATPYADTSGVVPANTVDTANADIFLRFPDNPTAATAAARAATFQVGDEILLVQGGTDFINQNGQPSMTVAVITAPLPAVVTAAGINYVHLTHTTTGTVVCPTKGNANVGGIPPQDPLGIYDIAECDRFTNTFTPGTDYVIRLTSTKYSVDTVTTAGDPMLVRTTSAGAKDVIAEQIIGFKVNGWSNNTQTYSNDPATYNSDWSSIRSVQIQVVARAAPNSDVNAKGNHHNTYDQGQYQVQGVSFVINPRNLNTN